MITAAVRTGSGPINQAPPRTASHTTPPWLNSRLSPPGHRQASPHYKEDALLSHVVDTSVQELAPGPASPPDQRARSALMRRRAVYRRLSADSASHS